MLKCKSMNITTAVVKGETFIVLVYGALLLM